MKLFDLSNFNLVLSFLKSRGVHGSVRFGFYQKKITKLILKKKKPKPNRNWFKPTSFGSVF
jgi:hypothetical protein